MIASLHDCMTALFEKKNVVLLQCDLQVLELLLVDCRILLWLFKEIFDSFFASVLCSPLCK